MVAPPMVWFPVLQSSLSMLVYPCEPRLSRVCMLAALLLRDYHRPREIGVLCCCVFRAWWFVLGNVLFSCHCVAGVESWYSTSRVVVCRSSCAWASSVLPHRPVRVWCFVSFWFGLCFLSRVCHRYNQG
ncbi:hypothetical protein PTSG_12638 [Salpingoeca rosetta]|uniref:Uncharacterized protein n=1 Tax=Salpingoeca rosetta (strain ATCC 50818 / BSB-021) TaxID=946362 RepID=F2UGD5_SALR5|nr:uncharacterized protein PTSG_12638 [Salpingoeca rosetta]EGD75685.1 hypothetical protein PTSG_12638 [Salpingoeca rosetta]|eukprot:XP_004991606.1 hypothetical protein PTSG_12638 [Salpingoeca rosetta]